MKKYFVLAFVFLPMTVFAMSEKHQDGKGVYNGNQPVDSTVVYNSKSQFEQFSTTMDVDLTEETEGKTSVKRLLLDRSIPTGLSLIKFSDSKDRCYIYKMNGYPSATLECNFKD